MKHNNLYITLIALLCTTWLFNSCTKDESLSVNPTIETRQTSTANREGREVDFDRDETDRDSKIILGRKRENPFAIANVNEANDFLYGANAFDQLPTHKYIKFKPTTHDHLAELENWETYSNISLFDFPIEYEIISSGETYYDEDVDDPIYTFQYSAIPLNTELPEVPYEVIEGLNLDKSNPLLLSESFWITDNKDEINEYVFLGGLSVEIINDYDEEVIQLLKIPPYPDYPCPDGYEWRLVIDDSSISGDDRPVFIWVCKPVSPPPPPPTNACGCPIPSNHRNPAGCVRVDFDGSMVPVEIASIKVKDTWFTSDLTFTDENGCWRVNENYSGRVWMWVRFKNENIKARDLGYWLSLRAVRDYVGKFNSPPYNNILVQYSSGVSNNTSTARRYWAAAHSLNTVNQYRNFASADGIPQPKKDLNWTNSAGTGGAAAPMLQWQVFSSWPAFLAAWQFPLIYAISLPHLPDVVNQYAPNESAATFTGTGFHELGHASHYSLVGESYWVGYRNHIINNGGYGNFGSFSGSCCAERVALGEAIGNFTGAIYGGTAGGGENFEFQNNFIPRGLMWDLGDDTPSDFIFDPNAPGISGPDNISGFTPNMIFNGLTPNVDDIRSFRDRLGTLHLGDTPNNLGNYNSFVDIYDVFN